MFRTGSRTLASMLALAVVCSALAQNPPPTLPGVKVTKRPAIDGAVSPEEWAGIPSVTGFIDPYTSQAAKDQTVAYLAYDAEGIYMAFVMTDSDPGSIVGREITPNSEFEGEDTVTFTLNPFNARTFDGLSKFHVNVLGTQSETISGGRASKREWRGEWQAATKRTETGWTCEISIPWKILNYPNAKSINLDLNLARYQARTKTESRWADTTSSGKIELIGIWKGVEPPARKESAKLEGLAYLAPGYDERKGTLNGGVDLRYKFSQQVTGLLSVSPDFRNIEGQVAGVEFSRTERFLDDTRPFFTEGSGFFDLNGMFNFGRMFYTRRIEDFDLGAKVFGQVDSNTRAGLLVTRETGEDTASVFSLKRSFGANGGATLYSTYRSQLGVEENAVGGSVFRRFGNFGAGVDAVMEKRDGRESNSAGSAYFEYQVPRWFTLVRASWIEPQFDSSLAYIPWTDRKGGYSYSEHNAEYKTGPIQSLHLDLFATYFETYAGRVQETGIEQGISAVTWGDTKIKFGKSTASYLGEVEQFTSAGLTFNDSNRFKKFGIFRSWGERNGVKSAFVGFEASRRVLRKVDIGVGFSHFDEGTVSQQSIITLAYEVDPFRSISGRTVIQDGQVNSYFAYRSAGGKGSELYVILGDPNSEKTKRRVSIKYVWPF